MKQILIILLLIPSFLCAQQNKNISFRQTEYQESMIEKVQPQLIDCELINDTLKVRIGTVSNSSGIFKADYFYKNDTLSIVYESGSLVSVATLAIPEAYKK